MTKTNFALAIAVSGLLAGCADGGLGSAVQTSSVDPNVAKLAAAQAAKPDPTCVALLAKIDGIRKEGVTERVEQASQGKSTTVPVKRASLAQIAELQKANGDYQSKCSAPGLKSAYVAPVAAPVAAAPAATGKPAVKKATAAPMAKPIVKPVAAVAPAAAPVAPAPVPVAIAPPAAPVAAPIAAVPVTQVPVPVAAVAPLAPAAPAASTTAQAAAAVAQQAAAQAAQAAAAKAAANVSPMPSIPGVSIAGQ